MGGCGEARWWAVVEQRRDERIARWQLGPLRREILILRIASGRLALHKPHDARESCFVGIYLSVVVDDPDKSNSRAAMRGRSKLGLAQRVASGLLQPPDGVRGPPAWRAEGPWAGLGWCLGHRGRKTAAEFAMGLSQQSGGEAPGRD